MGIYAKGSQFPADVEADTPQNRYGDLLTKDSPAGDALGETIAEVNATASSANTTVGELIADIEALEGRVDALEDTETSSGDGWYAYKRGGVVTVVFDGLSGSFNLPVGFRPPVILYTPRATEDGSAGPGRIRIRPDGLVTRRGDTTGSFYGVATYLTI